MGGREGSSVSSLTIYSDGRLAYQDTSGCSASGSLRLHDMDLLVLSFDMQSCPVAVRNGAYRGIGYSRGRGWEIGPNLVGRSRQQHQPGAVLFVVAEPELIHQRGGGGSV